MNYFSHVLYFPESRFFLQPEFRWFNFLGYFVLPLMQNRVDRYWCTYYGDHVRFRIYLNDYSTIQSDLEALRDELGLIDKGEEKDLTLIKDLGHSRFLAPNSRSTDSQRAEFVLNYLNSISRLLVDNLVQRQDQNWELEKSESEQNPLGNNFETLAHLMANMTQFQFDVSVDVKTIWMNQTHSTQSFRCNL